jgi:hypothetical protein
MIVEVRTYRVKPGRRAEFVRFFETKVLPALQNHGVKVIGPLLDRENPNKFVWLRSFSSLTEREDKNAAFYASEVWEKELEPIAMSMLGGYDFILCEASPGSRVDDLPQHRTPQ